MRIILAFLAAALGLCALAAFSPLWPPPIAGATVCTTTPACKAWTAYYGVYYGSDAVGRPVADISSFNGDCTPLIGADGWVDLTVGTPCVSILGTTNVIDFLNGGASARVDGDITNPSPGGGTSVLTVSACGPCTLKVGDLIQDIILGGPSSSLPYPFYIQGLGTGSGGIGTYVVGPGELTKSARSFVAGAQMSFVYNLTGDTTWDLPQATTTKQGFFVASGCGPSADKPCFLMETGGRNYRGASDFVPGGSALTLAGYNHRMQSDTAASTIISAPSGNNVLDWNSTPETDLNNGTFGTKIVGGGSGTDYVTLTGVMNTGVGAAALNRNGAETTTTVPAATQLDANTGLGSPIEIGGQAGVTMAQEIGEAGVIDNYAMTSTERKTDCHDRAGRWNITPAGVNC